MFDTTKARTFVKRFRKDEDGSLIIFSLFIFGMMFLVGGLAVDLMRFEVARSQLQGTMDRALLAAADLDQELSPADVVRDYFEKAGMGEYLVGDAVVDQGVNYRNVSAEARIILPTLFLDILHVYPHYDDPTRITHLSAPAFGTASESVDEIEISLVLDISGSMGDPTSDGSQTKLAALQEAASAFVDIIYERADPDDISISVVPYSTQVSLPQYLADEYNITRSHNYSTCVNFESADFNSTALATSQALEQTQHFDPFTNTGPLSTGDMLFVCRPENAATILPLSGDPTTLKTHINALTDGGNTSIDVGIKWGAALLDPSAQSVVSSLISSGDVSNAFAGRPYTTASGQSMKIIVVMTDGINTDQYMLPDSWRTSMSDVYKDDSDNHLWVDSDEEGSRDGDGSWDERWFYPRASTFGWGNFWRNNGSAPSDLTRMSTAQLLSEVSLYYNAYYHWYRQHWWVSEYNEYYSNALERVVASEKETRMDAICDDAKQLDNNMILYTIGFEVTDASAIVMEQCASSPSHFYRVAGPEIMDAFQAIARQINELRLTE